MSHKARFMALVSYPQLEKKVKSRTVLELADFTKCC